MLLDCFGILLVSDLVHSVLKKHALAVVLADKLIRNLALTETGNLETVLVLVVRLLKSCVPLFLVSLKADYYLRVFFLLNCGCHVISSKNIN